MNTQFFSEDKYFMAYRVFFINFYKLFINNFGPSKYFDYAPLVSGRSNLFNSKN